MPHLFAAFIRERKHEIIARWMDAAQELPSARALSALAIRDHIPEMLDELRRPLTAST